MTEKLIPFEALEIQDEGNWASEILGFAYKLVTEGKRPWFEVHYPAPKKLSQEEATAWLIAQRETFDAVEVKDGVITTLPPYVELLEGKDDGSLA